MNRTSTILRIAVLLGAVSFFALPFLASAYFGFTLPGRGFTFEPLMRLATGRSAFWDQLGRTLLLALCTAVVGSALLTSTLLWLHLRARKLLPIAEGLSVLPFVVPPVALVMGANLFFRSIYPGFLTHLLSLVPFYVIITMPLMYRALDSGMLALDLRTLVDAGKSLGARRLRILIQILLPNLAPAMIASSLICVAMVLGEFVMASLLLHNTFPVFLAQAGQDNPRAAAALAFLTMVGTWLLLAAVARTLHTPRRPQ
ncbi:ABC transporter permease [Nesterenkonia alba]|uniref:ABC transporter permease n=1 Tax=Nesterenkonia alba TaxID=515814 RepID=UPI0003B5EC0F|nr:ABC transporter permease subunit [Nesterenkonia alba]